MKMHLKMLREKWRPFCLSLNVFTVQFEQLNNIINDKAPSLDPDWLIYTYIKYYHSGNGQVLKCYLVLVSFVS